VANGRICGHDKMKSLCNRFLELWLLLALATGMARAETVVWSDNFETNFPSRWTNSGIWHISSPTAGPAPGTNGFRTFSGTNCASTQNYPYSQDARLVCTNYNGTNWLVVPAANQSPRLRFWHWFNFDNALGFVEINTGSNNWQQISPTYLNVNGGGVWSRPSIDLSAYAGQSVQIAFHFTSGGYVGNGLGWFVDDVALVTGSPALNLPESFEAGPKTNDWAVDFGTWEIGPPTSGPNKAHNGDTNCAGTVLAGNYANNVDTRLISPPFPVPASGSAMLNFWQWYSFKNALGYVEINTGTTSTISTTNTVITTNAAFSGLDTNIYQLFGAAITNYATPLYWNSTVGGWTNATKALASVYDGTTGIDSYLFEAGNAPLIGGYEDYISYSPYPIPQSTSPTNFSAMQGMTWSSATGGGDKPVGYFGTNYTYTYTTNVTVTSNNWQTVASTLIKSVGTAVVASPGWTNAIIDLSAYAGQTVQVAFHFTTGGLYTAPGWYVDDLSFVAYPALIVPDTQTINAGQTLTVTNFATNSLNSGINYTFALVPPATNAVITTNGVLTLTNTAGLAGTYVYTITATDNSVPSLAATNSFTVIVLPPAAPSLAITNSRVSGRPVFQFSFQTGWTNTTWRLEATTNLAKASWLPVFTNLIGGGGTLSFTDLLATNFPLRFYRAVFP